MKTRAFSIGIVLLALGFANANQGSPYEDMLKQLIDNFDKISMTLKKIDDEPSAMAAKPELRKLSDAFVKGRAKAAKIQPPEKDEKARLEKQYKPKLDEALKKLFTEVTRVREVKGGEDALKEISSILKKDSK